MSEVVAIEKELSSQNDAEKESAAITGGSADAAMAKKNKKKEKEKLKKEKEKEEKKDAAKKKTKTTTSDLIKEAMKLRLEEEQKLKKKQEEEEARMKALEEERLRKLKEEQEKKIMKKQKEKERVERLKREGKYLNPEQRQKLARQRQMVEHMKQQGLIVGPFSNNIDVAAKKSNKVGQKKKLEKVDQSKEASPENEEMEIFGEEKEEKESEPDDDLLESWDMVEDIDDIKAGDVAEKKSGVLERKNSSEVLVEQEQPKAEEKSASTIEEVKQSAHNNTEVVEKLAPKDEFRLKEKEPIPDRIKRRQEERLQKKMNVLRSPVICVLGHVDTGKTKILDKIRQTHVQDAEAGGITQQIGATFVPSDAIKEKSKMVNNYHPTRLKLPGYLIIDTPGHESFSNLRLRGSSLCDIAILVVDIMHGLEPQTIESLNMLKKRKTPFVVALNKIDRLYEWKSQPQSDVEKALKGQKGNTKIEFKDRYEEVLTQFAEQGINIALFWDLEKKDDKGDYVAVIPTSAHSGDGMGNLMWAIAQICQIQHEERLLYNENLECSVLEVKALPGLGTTIDVVLLNGRLRVGDDIIVAGMEGPIVTQIRELLMPEPLRELRVKNEYKHYKELTGAQGIKILAKDLDKALAGIPLMVAENKDEIDYFKNEVAKLLEHTLHSIKLCDKGVYVQASTLGSLEALLDFLRSQKIPYSGVNIGPVHRKDVMKASAMLEHDTQFAVILAFDVKVERDAELAADELGVRIFHADIIYHLQDAFLKYREELRLKKRQENAHLAIFPCKLRILPQHVFKTRDPIVFGVSVEDGVVKVGTPICVPSKESIFLGTVSSIEINQKAIESARKGQEVAIKIENTTGDAPKMYGRHFDYQDLLVSRITRDTIEVCKQYFREDLQKTDWLLMIELKKTLNIL